MEILLNNSNAGFSAFLWLERFIKTWLILFSPMILAQNLTLSNKPLFIGSNVQPNILIAVDDSSSMDYEVIFPTFDGLLYWHKVNKNFSVNGVLNTRKTLSDNRVAPYSYLFPNGCNNDSNHGRRILCDNQHQALPPLPQYAFARSPQYNSEYFDPTVTYKHWTNVGDENFADADPEHAYYDPTANAPSPRIDLTITHEETGRYKEFDFEPGMVIPKGIKYYHGGSFHSEDTDKKITSAKHIGISYYPATFYLPLPPSTEWSIAACQQLLPANYGYQGEPLKGYKPDGKLRLCGFEIAPGTEAMQNFANWFTYYRKRHLAVRAGIAAAFKNIDSAYVGKCTINNDQPDRLPMRDLSKPVDKQDFYESIFNTAFWRGGGTPNRKGLKYLGDQLEHNANIITSPCQRNFAILFTDGFNSEGVSGIGNVDGNDGAPFADRYGGTIADTAMRYYEKLNPKRDLARHKVPVSTACHTDRPPLALDCQDNPHMVTFGVTLDQKGSIFNNPAYPLENADPYAHPPDWPNPNNRYRDDQQIDDLWHATVNTRGALLNAKTPAKIAEAFASALKTILNDRGSASGIAVNGDSLSNDSVAYQTSFVGGKWTGELAAYSIANGINKNTLLWRASSQLTDPDQTTPADRVILTSVKQNDETYQPKAFEPDNLQGSLGDLAGPNGRPLAEKDVVNYIRGDRSKEKGQENGVFRYRGNDILGDIVHSTPVYVGAPDRYRYPAHWQDLRYSEKPMPENEVDYPYSDPTTNTAFAQKYAQREPMVYVGANDGMLHGFDAKTGQEKLAYVPGVVLPNLVRLTDPNYAHRYYVDGSPTAGDVVYADDNGKKAWHTVLVGGERNGGRSIFALDVTDPSGKISDSPGFSETDPAATVLWEYTDSQLGQTYSKPSIVRLHDGKWAALFGNGYNSDNGCAVLYLVDIKTGEPIKKITASDAPDNSDLCRGNGNGNGKDNNSGLSTPFPVDLDGDFITDYAYAGDLHGNLWKFDLTSNQPSHWTATKLFTTTDAEGHPQPITSQPQVGLHPYGKDYGVMVYFGTGKYLETGDAQLNTTVRNSVYGIWDADVFTFNEAKNGQPLFSIGTTNSLNRWDLNVEQRATDIQGDGKPYRLVSDKPVHYQQTANERFGRGWVLDLPPKTGELIISKPQIQDGTVGFSTTIPSVRSCTGGGSSGYYMVVDAATGGRTASPAFDLNGDHLFNTSDMVTVDNDKKVGVSGIAITNGAPGQATHMIDRAHEDNQVMLPISNGDAKLIAVNTGRRPDRRRSWREIRR